MAAFSRLTLDAAGSGYTITATSDGLVAATTAPINVVPAAAARLVVTVPPPSTVTAGDGFGLSVGAVDAYGNAAPSFGPVTVAAGDGTPGGTTIAFPSGGVARFSGLVLDAVGTYSLQVSGFSLGPVAAGTVTVTPAAASHLVVTAQPPGSLTAGAGFGLQVEAEDPYGNPAMGFNGPVTAALARQRPARAGRPDHRGGERRRGVVRRPGRGRGGERLHDPGQRRRPGRRRPPPSA